MLKKTIFVVILSLFLVGCGSSEVDDSNKYLVKSELLVDLNSSVLGTTFGYKAYKIVYNTTYKGENIEASGLLVLPTGYEAIEGFSLSMVCDAHGTIFADSEVPTANFLPNLNPIGAGFSATAGFMTIQPDAIGFGQSKEVIHPYMMKNTADASIDMIQAVIEFAKANYIPINGQLFLSGYSEGGYVTMATLQELETNYTNTLKVMAAAPMEAPYNLDLMAQGVFNSEMMPVPSFPGFLAYSYADYFDTLSLDQLIASHYASTMPALFDQTLTRAEIDPQLSYVTQEFFNLTAINSYFTNANDDFKALLVENSVHNWTPKSKMRLYHCDEDPVIPFVFSQEAYGNFMANGATDVELVTMSGNDHAGCAGIAYPQVIEWFDQVRRGEE